MSTPSSPGSSMRANASSSTAHGNLTNDNNSDGPSPSKNSGSIEPRYVIPQKFTTIAVPFNMEKSD